MTEAHSLTAAEGGFDTPAAVSLYLQGSRQMINVACLMMQKNEDDLLEPWLLYYGNLFGYSNLFVYDNGSTSRKVIDTLSAYARRSVNVDFSKSRPIDFDRHEAEFGRRFGQLEAENRFDLFLPVDCDEFLMLDGDPPSCDAAEIRAHLATLVDRPGVLQIPASFANCVARPSWFWRHGFQKLLFSRAGGCARLGHGFHTGEARRPGPPVATRLAQAHFHFKPYETLVAHARNKLEYYVDVTDPEKLRCYNGLNAHLVAHLLRGPREYYAAQAAENAAASLIALPQLAVALAHLGAEPFWERWGAEAGAAIAAAPDGIEPWTPPRLHGIQRLAHRLAYASRAASRKIHHVGRWLETRRGPV